MALPLVLGGGYTSSAALITSDLESPVTYPQIVHGGGFSTTMRFFNPNSLVFTGTLRFFNPDGTPREVTLAGLGTGSEFQLTIPPKGTIRLDTFGATPTVTVGMARLDSTYPIGGTATILFGSTHFGVPNSPRMRSARIPVDTTGGRDTGVAIGAGFDEANFKITLQDRDGVGGGTVQPGELTPLAMNGQYARFVTELGFSGTADVSDSSILFETVGPGAFVPLALLNSSGVFSTTAAARQTLYGPDDFAGSYSGIWENDVMLSGPMSAAVQLAPEGNAATITIDVPDQFGMYSLNGLFTPDGLSANSGGLGTLTVKPDGTFSLRPDLSYPDLMTLTLTGQFDGAKFTGEFELMWPTFMPMVPTRGTWSLIKN